MYTHMQLQTVMVVVVMVHAASHYTLMYGLLQVARCMHCMWSLVHTYRHVHCTHTWEHITSLTATGSTADVMTPNSKAAAGIQCALSMPAAPTPYTQAPTASALNRVP